MPVKEAMFWTGITVFGTGLFLVFEKDVSKLWAIILIVAGLLFAGYSVYQHHYPAAVVRFPMWFVLLVLTWLVLGFDFYDRHYGLAGPDVLHWKNVPEMVRIDGRHFVNEKVELDNHAYTNCTFRNVTFIYNGNGPVTLQNIDLFPPMVFETHSDIVLTTFGMLKGLGINPETAPITFEPNGTPYPGLEPPHHVP